MINAFLLVLLLVGLGPVSAQLSENFDRTPWQWHPVWSGDTTAFVVSDSLLRSAGPASSSRLWVSTQNTQFDSAYWEMSFCLDFNPSSTNYLRIYLAASSPDLESAINGYFVQLGETSASIDTLRLFRQDVTSSTELLSGRIGCASSTISNCVKLRVQRDPAGHWQMESDCAGLGYFVSEGNCFDDTYFADGDTTWFGPLCRYVTSSRANAYAFDYFEIGRLAPDTTPPALISTQLVDSASLLLSFSEPVIDLGELGNYQLVSHGDQSPAAAAFDSLNPAEVMLTFSPGFHSGDTTVLSISGLVDRAGNGLTVTSDTFVFYRVKPGDLVISEVLFDPEPVNGLPAEEFVELVNLSPYPIKLTGWSFSDASGAGQNLPISAIGPFERLILCDQSAASVFRSFGEVLGLEDWPSLNNSGDTLWLKDQEGTPIGRVGYHPECLEDAEKLEGGWSLEMIDLSRPYLGNCNWSYSNHPAGGTPGATNQPTETPSTGFTASAVPLGVQPMDSLLITFGQGIDSGGLSEPSNYILKETGALPVTAKPWRESGCRGNYTGVLLQLPAPLQTRTRYELTIQQLVDCKGRLIEETVVPFGLDEPLSAGDILINEVLFDPPTGGFDYVELVNASNKIVSTKDLFIEEWSSEPPVSLLEIAKLPVALLFPEDLLLLTENSDWVVENFNKSDHTRMYEVKELPNFPDDEGAVGLVLATDTGQLRMDFVQYDASWHFPLLREVEGVSLERISLQAASHEAANWHSGIEKGSPGKPNTNVHQLSSSGVVTIEPDRFSPNADGVDDLVFISYRFEGPARVANVGVYDLKGRLVKVLASNDIIAADGMYKWDGSRFDGYRASPGIYIVLFEVFDLTGARAKHKRAFALENPP